MLTFFAIGFILFHFTHSSLLTKYANRKLDTFEKKDFTLNVQKIRIASYIPLIIEINNFGVLKGQMKSTKWDINLSKVLIHTGFSKLSSKTIDKLEIKKITATLIETNPKLDKIKKEKEKEGTSLSIRELRIEDSQFHYIDKDPKAERSDGELLFENIAIKADDIVVKESNLQKPAELKARGELAKNKIYMDLRLDSFKKDFNLQLKSKIIDADVSSVNSYVLPVEKIRLHGKILSSYTFSEMEDKHLHTKTKAKYRDLKIDVLPSPDRSMALSVAMDVIANLKICDSNIKNKGLFEETSSDLNQKDESVVQFLLRGLLENFLKISCLK